VKEDIVIEEMNMQDGLMGKEINFESLSEYLTKEYPDREILPDKQYDQLQMFVQELSIHGISTIEEVHKILERTKIAAELFEKDVPPNPVKGGQYSATCIARISVLLLYKNFYTFTLNGSLSEKLEKYRPYILPE
jgi:hypothetical protein